MNGRDAVFSIVVLFVKYAAFLAAGHVTVCIVGKFVREVDAIHRGHCMRRVRIVGEVVGVPAVGHSDF